MQGDRSALVQEQRAHEAILVVVLNEADVIGPFLAELAACAPGRRVYLLDSGSQDATVAEAQAVQGVDLVVVDCPPGLAAAIRHGVQLATEPRLVVVDGDGQHDPRVVPALFDALETGHDVVVGSRKVPGARVAEDWPRFREALSTFLLTIVRTAVRCHGVRDPLSGCFALRREAWLRTDDGFETGGYKFLLDFLAASPKLRVAELPINFRARRGGASKVALAVPWELLVSVLRGVLRGLLPRRWLSFGCVGAMGFVTDMAVTGTLHGALGIPFAFARPPAIAAGMAQNYFLNNHFTFHDATRRGKARLTWGFVLYAACQALGAGANWLVSVACFRAGLPWPIAVVAGAAVGFGINFATASKLVWRRPQETNPR